MVQRHIWQLSPTRTSGLSSVVSMVSMLMKTYFKATHKMAQDKMSNLRQKNEIRIHFVAFLVSVSVSSALIWSYCFWNRGISNTPPPPNLLSLASLTFLWFPLDGALPQHPCPLFALGHCFDEVALLLCSTSSMIRTYLSYQNLTGSPLPT